MIAIDNLWKTYPGATALHGISMRVDEGRVLGVLGENGSGKSTLFKVLAGVTRASEGTVLIDGMEIGRETRRVVSYLPEVSPFYEWMRVGEQLDFVAAFYPDWQPEKATELLQLMRLETARKVGALSDGQRARLKVVAAFARPSAVVLMDAPLGSIDPPSRKRIIGALLREYRMGEQTILISTHLVEDVEELIEDVVFLRQGEIALSGNSDELRSERSQSLSDMFEEVVS